MDGKYCRIFMESRGEELLRTEIEGPYDNILSFICILVCAAADMMGLNYKQVLKIVKGALKDSEKEENDEQS